MLYVYTRRPSQRFCCAVIITESELRDGHRGHRSRPDLPAGLVPAARARDQRVHCAAAGPAGFPVLHADRHGAPRRDDRAGAGTHGQRQLVCAQLTYLSITYSNDLSAVQRFYYEFQKVKNSTAIADGQESKKIS